MKSNSENEFEWPPLQEDLEACSIIRLTDDDSIDVTLTVVTLGEVLASNAGAEAVYTVEP